MPMLTLKFKKNTIADYPLQKGKSVTIGRRTNNDIVVENLAVSGHHAKIDSIGDGFVLTDLQSKNGCFVNEQLVTSHWLKSGDIINIGKHTLVFSYNDNEVRPEEGDGQVDQTIVMDANLFRNMVSDPPSQQSPAAAENSQPLGVLSFLSGGDGEITLTKKLTKIGKDPSADIVVSGLGVGHTAATISMRPNGFHLSHVSGLFKAKVNGEAVKDTIQLKEFDIIELGSTKLQFFTKD
ncbi:MAG: FHA domain-containing protein [Desulfobacterales bacterium]|jgi:pSer/pThr/pTyr-binding forkhead associated (FHA) protein